MPGRKFGSENRYGFNGKENDRESNWQAYGERDYDPRISRLFAVDPLAPQYPELTPYQFASNRPIDGIDLLGLQFLQVHSQDKYQTSLYRLFNYEDLATDYKLNNQIWVTDTKIHKIIMNHPDNKGQLDQTDDSTPEVRVADNSKKRGENKRQQAARINKEVKSANRAARADIAGGIIDLVLYVQKEYYEYSNSKELTYGRISLGALDKADRVVRSASNNSSFPEKLNNDIIKKDLVNYLTYGYIREDASLEYQLIISAWGNLLLNNADKILDKKYVFSSQKVVIEFHESGSGSTRRRFMVKYTVGNPDEELKKANDLIKENVPVPGPVLKN